MDEDRISQEIRRVLDPVFAKWRELNDTSDAGLDLAPLQSAVDEVVDNGTLDEALAHMPSDTPAWLELREMLSKICEDFETAGGIQYEVTVTRHYLSVTAQRTDADGSVHVLST